MLLVFSFPNLSVSQSDFPDVKGKIVKTMNFNDDLGQNTLILSELEYKSTNQEIENCEVNGHCLSVNECKEDSNCLSKEIYAYLYRSKNNKNEKIWQVRDFVHSCHFGGFTAEFILEAIKITDLDKNGIKEVWLPYTLSCSSEISPETMKIIMYENKTKYAIRGSTKICYFTDKINIEGGDYKADKNLRDKKDFLKYGLDLWHKHYISGGDASCK